MSVISLLAVGTVGSGLLLALLALARTLTRSTAAAAARTGAGGRP